MPLTTLARAGRVVVRGLFSRGRHGALARPRGRLGCECLERRQLLAAEIGLPEAAAPPTQLTLSTDRTAIVENDTLGFLVATIELSPAPVEPITVQLASSSTRIGFPGTLHFAAGTSTTSFPVFVIDNLLPDGDETVTLSATTAGAATAVDLQVLDDEGPAGDPPGVTLQADGTLVIQGTDQRDVIRLRVRRSELRVNAVLDGTRVRRRIPLDDISSIRIKLGDGNDNLSSVSSLNIPIEADGGGGNDTLRGGSANDVLRGGPGNDRIDGRSGDDILLGDEGNDRLRGNRGRDVMIGGYGVDTIIGGRSDDLLFDGTTAYDAFDEALLAIRDTWTENVPLADRLAELATGFGSGDQFRLVAGQTVLADGSRDSLRGNRDDDVYFASLTQDRVSKTSRELLEDADRVGIFPL